MMMEKCVNVLTYSTLRDEDAEAPGYLKLYQLTYPNFAWGDHHTKITNTHIGRRLGETKKP